MNSCLKVRGAVLAVFAKLSVSPGPWSWFWLHFFGSFLKLFGWSYFISHLWLEQARTNLSDEHLTCLSRSFGESLITETLLEIEFRFTLKFVTFTLKVKCNIFKDWKKNPLFDGSSNHNDDSKVLFFKHSKSKSTQIQIKLF